MKTPQEAFLELRGWQYEGTTFPDRRYNFPGRKFQISWFRKFDRTFPLHFAVWLEEHGWRGQF